MHETYAFVATIPGREKALDACLRSLDPQVDYIGVFYDKFDPKKRLEPHPLATFVSYGDVGDGGKFWWLQHRTPPFRSGQDFVLTCDDDLAYPADYVEAMRRHRMVCNGPVGVHGARLPSEPTHYRKQRRVFHCLHGHEMYTSCNVLGTGTLAGYADELMRLVANTDFADPPNVADIHFALAAQARLTKLHVVPRPPNWLTYLLEPDAPTIWSQGRVEVENALMRRRKSWVSWKIDS